MYKVLHLDSFEKPFFHREKRHIFHLSRLWAEREKRREQKKKEERKRYGKIVSGCGQVCA